MVHQKMSEGNHHIPSLYIRTSWITHASWWINSNNYNKNYVCIIMYIYSIYTYVFSSHNIAMITQSSSLRQRGWFFAQRCRSTRSVALEVEQSWRSSWCGGNSVAPSIGPERLVWPFKGPTLGLRSYFGTYFETFFHPFPVGWDYRFWAFGQPL